MGFETVQAFQDALFDKGIAGNDLAVYHGGEPIHRYRTGWACVEERRPISADTIYQMYSMTKPITCAAMLKLIEQGAARLDDPLYAYLPAYRRMRVRADGGTRPAVQPILLEHLFTMTAGFDYDLHSPAIERIAERKPHFDLQDFALELAEEPLWFEPGTRYQYSLCHDVLAAVLEVVSGMRYGEYLRRSLFDPLGMADACFFLPEAKRSRLARKYPYVPNRRPARALPEANEYQLSPVFESGGAGLYATVDDYACFANALCLEQGILSPATLRQLRTNRLSGQPLADYHAFKPKAEGYGLGVYTSLAADGHGPFGWGGAAGTYLILLPEERLTVILAYQTLPSGGETVRPLLLHVLWDALREEIPGFSSPVPYLT